MLGVISESIGGPASAYYPSAGTSGLTFTNSYGTFTIGFRQGSQNPSEIVVKGSDGIWKKVALTAL